MIRGRSIERAPLFPSVHFAAGFVRRVERCVLHLLAARERREGAGSAALAGSGEEFVGYRPYRTGEDLRPIDWNLFARLNRPYVRVTRREASEHWAIVLDRSASMAVGPPGKLQAAAEMAVALASVAARQGAHVRLVAPSASQGPVQERTFRGARDLAELMAALEGMQAEGRADLAETLARWRPGVELGRVFLLGDLLDLEPSALTRLRRRGRELFVLQFLAPHELAPQTRGGVHWFDPETSATLAMDLSPKLVSAYQRELEAMLQAWQNSCARHGLRYLCSPSQVPFEELLPRLFGFATVHQSSSELSATVERAQAQT